MNKIWYHAIVTMEFPGEFAKGMRRRFTKHVPDGWKCTARVRKHWVQRGLGPTGAPNYVRGHSTVIRFSCYNQAVVQSTPPVVWEEAQAMLCLLIKGVIS